MREIDSALRASLCALLGGANRLILRPETEEPLQHGCPIAILTHSSVASSVGNLRDRVFTPRHVFAALPSFTATRWLAPLGNSRWAARAMRIHPPYKRRARLLRAVVLGLLKAGWMGWARDRVLISSKGPLPLEILIREVVEERRPVLALFLGAPGRYRKLTIQVMRWDGQILGYLKLPLTEAATVRVRHEAAVLEHLWNYAALRPHIPKVLHAGEWGNGYVLFQSSGPSRPGPVRFGTLHEEFLQSLWGVRRTEKPGYVFVDAVAARWLKAEPLLNSQWRSLGGRALELARRELRGAMIPSGISHGDFAPWNSRVEDGRLFLFDWESAGWGVPNLWDIFHFHVQVASLLNRNGGGELSFRRTPGERAVSLLYVLNSTCNLLEGAPNCQAGLKYRHRILLEQLS